MKKKLKKIGTKVIDELYNIKKPILNLVGFGMVIFLIALFLSGLNILEDIVGNDFQVYILVFIMIIYVLLMYAYFYFSEGFFGFTSIFFILFLIKQNQIWIHIATWYVYLNIAIYTLIECKKIRKDSKKKSIKKKK